jgi:hypothetical protein
MTDEINWEVDIWWTGEKLIAYPNNHWVRPRKIGPA